MNNDLISREALKKALKSNCDLCHDKNTNWCERCCPLNDFEDLIDEAPTVESFEDKIIELFNKYDVLVIHIGDKLEPVRNTSKQDCYKLLYDIGELIDWRRRLFKKYHGGEDNG